MPRRRPWVLVAGVLVTGVSFAGTVAGADDKVPTIDEMISLKWVGAHTGPPSGPSCERVPPPNAFELYQGLQDQGVPVKLVIYKGFGHGLNKPKAARAAMEHNWEWFDEHLWNATPAPAAGEPRR